MSATALPRRAVASPAVWTSFDVADPTPWTIELTACQREELAAVARSAHAAGRTPATLDPLDVRLPSLAETLGRTVEHLTRGRGFVLLRGFPVDLLDPEEVELAYVALGLHLGTPVRQDGDGTLLGHVRDDRVERTGPEVRLYRTRERPAAADQPPPAGAPRRWPRRHRTSPVLDLLPAAPGSAGDGWGALDRFGRSHTARRRAAEAVLLTSTTLGRKATAEAVGTGLLVAIVVGSGIFAERLSPDDVGLQLLESSIATAAGLVALILAFGSVSGAHLNPVVSLADRMLGGLSTRELAAYVPAQVVGACVGAMVANLMFDLDAINVSTHVRDGGGVLLGEVVATFGLVTVILGVVRSGRASTAPFAVAGYIGAAYWFTSSTSFANPAVTVGRTLSDTFAGIDPSSVPAFVVAQVLGGLAAVGLVLYLFPERPALDLVVPHDHSEAA